MVVSLRFQGCRRRGTGQVSCLDPLLTRVTIISHSHVLLYSDWSVRIVKCFTLHQELSRNIRPSRLAGRVPARLMGRFTLETRSEGRSVRTCVQHSHSAAP